MKDFKFKRGYYTTCFVEESIISKANSASEAIEAIENEDDIPYLGVTDNLFIADYKVTKIDMDNVTPDMVEFIHEIKD